MSKDNILEVNAFIDYDKLTMDVYEKLKPELDKKQNIEEETLKTKAKNIPEAINELNDREPEKHIFYKLDELGLVDSNFSDLPHDNFIYDLTKNISIQNPMFDILKIFFTNEKFKVGDEVILNDEEINNVKTPNFYQNIYNEIVKGFNNLMLLSSSSSQGGISLYPIKFRKFKSESYREGSSDKSTMEITEMTINIPSTGLDNVSLLLRLQSIDRKTYYVDFNLDKETGAIIPFKERFFGIDNNTISSKNSVDIPIITTEKWDPFGMFNIVYKPEIIINSGKNNYFNENINFGFKSSQYLSNVDKKYLGIKLESEIDEVNHVRNFLKSSIDLKFNNYNIDFYNTTKVNYAFYATENGSKTFEITQYFENSYPNSFIYENLQNIYLKNSNEYKKVILQGEAVDPTNPEILAKTNVNMDLSTNSIVFKINNTNDNKGVFQIGYNPTVESDENIAKYKGEGSYIFNEMSGNFLYLKNNGVLGYDGSVITKGRITSLETVGQLSDERIKENFEILNNPFELIKDLTAYRYNFLHSNKTKIGFKAQDVLKVIPEIVDKIDEKDENSLLSLSYSELVPVLVECIKEMKKEINELKERLK